MSLYDTSFKLLQNFRVYDLNIAAYILNHVPKAPQELWSGCKPTLNHFWIWGYPTHVLKGKMSKLEKRSKVCYFIGYPKSTYGWYFYDPREKNVFISTNAIFLEDDYIMNCKPKRRIVLEEVMGEPSDSPTINNKRNKKIQWLYPDLHWYLVVVGGLLGSLTDSCSWEKLWSYLWEFRIWSYKLWKGNGR